MVRDFDKCLPVEDAAAVPDRAEDNAARYFVVRLGPSSVARARCSAAAGLIILLEVVKSSP